MADQDKHYSVIGRVTLCGKEVFNRTSGVCLSTTNAIELVDCGDCLKKHKARQILIAKSEVKP